MFDNPFTPVFGGKPDFFFGREDILSRFERALAIRGSEDRTLFVTGTRGNGKTTLLEQLSQRATESGWTAIDLTADNALRSFFRQIQAFDETSRTLDPKIEVKVLGSGGSASGKSITKTTRYAAEDINLLFHRACEKTQKGVFVSIDEIQKVPLEDVSQICGAFQMASRKGGDAILAVAGLPYAYDPAIQHDGCTYLRRAVHEELGLLTRDEVREAFLEAFARVRGLTLDDGALAELVRLSSGQPYMMQLLGFHLIEYVNGTTSAKKHAISLEEVQTVSNTALDAYERRALAPILSALGTSARSYLGAMAASMDDDHIADTGKVASTLGKTHQQLSTVRQSLIDEGIIVPAGHGRVRFAIPYLRSYLGKKAATPSTVSLLEEWDV